MRWDIIELLFFAYRDFVGDPDQELEAFGFGRAHHRVMHFVYRYPGLKVADLLDVLRITKQSLGRVLKQLLDEGYIVQKTGDNDRRQRLLYATPKGEALVQKLAGLQTTRITKALAEMAPQDAENRQALPARDDRSRRSGQGAGDDLRLRQSRPKGVTVPLAATLARPPVQPADDAPHLLLVDDDRRIRDLLSRFLAGEGYRVSTAASASDARSKLMGLHFDLLILDVMMPGETGFDLARFIRTSSSVPIVMLTARHEAEARIEGLQIGADDYVAKPFEPRELALRINNILKRAAPPPQAAVVEKIAFGPYVYHLDRGELRQGEEVIHLTDREREMLRILSETPGETVPRSALTGNGSVNERAVDVQINRLRRKIETDPANPLFLQAVRGIGYRLVASP
ncbi:DNA-binding response OmpR family regulator/DNA-binding MarR family transcriptional regulator [Bradyrhizobium diazoefficiens]